MNSVPSLHPSVIDLDILSNLTELIVVANLETRDEGYEEVDEDLATDSDEDTETDSDEETETDSDEDTEADSDEETDGDRQ